MSDSGNRWGTAKGIIDILAGVAVVFTLLFIGLQWREMRESGKDTHDLAVQAKAQADAAKAQADKMGESLKKTDDLIKATNDLAREAKRSADLAGKTLKIDQRAWVGVTVANLRNPPIQPDKPIEIAVNFSNTGKTPALHVFGFAQAILLHSEMQLDSFKIMPPIEVFKNTLFPGGANHFTRGIQALPQPLIDDIDHGATRIFLYGKITYSDVFTHEHWTNFCLFYSPQVKTFVYCQTRNNTDEGKEAK